MIRYFLPAVCRAPPCHLKLDVAIHRVHVNHQLILCRTDAVKSRWPESEWASMSSWWRSKPKPGVIDLNAPHWTICWIFEHIFTSPTCDHLTCPSALSRLCSPLAEQTRRRLEKMIVQVRMASGRYCTCWLRRYWSGAAAAECQVA